MRLEKNREAGLSTIELMISLVLIGVLAAILISITWTAVDSSKQRATMADMRSISRAIEAYVVDHEIVPDGGGKLTSLQDTFEIYMNAPLPVRDRWGNEFGFLRDGADDYTLISFGKDGRDGADYVRAARFDFNRDLVMFNGIFIAAPE